MTLRSHFAPNTRLLHAGCGVGEIDLLLGENWELHSLDYSSDALRAHRANFRQNQRSDLGVQGDIFALPFPANSFDGVFNLGVMEHFTDEEIVASLREIHRVLRVEGAVVLYWPPKWGLSVLVLRLLQKYTNLRTNQELNLYPPEINLIGSKTKCRDWLRRAGFQLEHFSFGWRDVFVHQVIVARPINVKS